MYRTIVIKCGRQANAIYRGTNVIVTKPMRRGESVILSDPIKRVHRDLEERLEVDRLAEMAREHALRN